MASTLPIITLITDFGERDSYVGTMKGILLNMLPDVRIVDITHQIAPQNIRQAAATLAEVYPFFPPHTVHLVVVDPGVGSMRDPIAIRTTRGQFVAPDNGVLTYVLQNEPEWKAIRLDNSAYWRDQSPSNTFHGRDIFSPVAAHLANGIGLEKLGSVVNTLTQIPTSSVTVSANIVKGEVMHVDHFGNVITNIKELRWTGNSMLELHLPDAAPLIIDAQKAHVIVGWHTIDGIYPIYSAVAQGQRLALIGSSGELEIAINQGNAAEKMAIKPGDPVSIRVS